ncbi:sister chromatid cohesion 1 protein 4-like isoform X2 [Impatiens glandulifera]|uniref:sister chromatid cohesion 1 protein 4-like isoform X2 n=1 Tax=Impatiens glandulifera TaxID=253017 RepID=UPI001FB15984|nr:sister chromatid cohesion 1 protein 4-like isoform X2 [Impatiens glandulifera]
MFYSQFILAKKGPLGTIWIAAHLERKLRKNQVADTDIGVSVDSILFPDMPIALRLSSHLLLGVVRIYSKKVNYLFDDCSEALLKIKQAFRSAAVDLPPEESTAPYHSITLPETFDLDDFELPDSDILLGNYVDHHISAREQITLQDTMEGVVYSTSQFGLDERFGDGDTSGLDLDEELFMNKVTGPVVDGNTLTSDVEGQPSNQGMIHDVKEDEDQDLSDNLEQVVADNENEAPPTPGLLEEPNLSNIQEVSACEDHMEVEDQNLPEKAVEDNSLNATSKWPNDASTLENECQASGQEINKLEEFDDGIGKNNDWNHGLEEAIPMPSHDMPVLESCNISDNHAEKSSLVGAVSNIVFNDYDEATCRTDVSDNPENPDNVQKPFGDSNVVESNAEVFQQHTQNEVDETPLEVIEPSFPQEPGICLEPQVEACMVEPHSPTADSSKLVALGNVNFDDANLDGLDRSNISDFPAPERLLSVPEEQSDPLANFTVDFTPNIENTENGNGDDVGTKQILGKKRTFTESTVTVQSLSSVESYEPVQSKRTKGSIPDDDDLLSSILVGRNPSALKLKATPAPSDLTTHKKRPRIVARTPASKKRVLMDDNMVLHGDMIRQQLMSTEDIRRQRKKAPCTRREICMIQKDLLEDDIFMEPILTGLSAHFVLLYSQTYDLSKINIYKSGAKNIGEGDSLISNDRIEHPVEGGSELINAAQTESEVINAKVEIFHGSHAEEQMNNPIGVPGPNSTTAELADLTELEIRETSTFVVDIGSVSISTDQFPPDALDNTASLQEKELGPLSFGTNEDGESNMLENEEKAKDEIFPEGTHVDGSIENCPVQDGEHGLDSNPCLPENVEVYDKVENEVFTLEEELIHNVLNPNLLDFDEEPKVDTLLTVDHDMDMTHAPLIDYEYHESERTDPSMATEITPTEHPAMEDHDFNYQDGHDTEFLNVDDDDAFENDDDCIPNGEEAGEMENSGWSSRTRSVAKYLQTLFDKEEIQGRRVLRMDNLLNGRTRKEASRMFFEALVLKTKDYIQVEQGVSFNNINLMPRGKLMKSDF